MGSDRSTGLSRTCSKAVVLRLKVLCGKNVKLSCLFGMASCGVRYFCQDRVIPSLRYAVNPLLISSQAGRSDLMPNFHHELCAPSIGMNGSANVQHPRGGWLGNKPMDRAFQLLYNDAAHLADELAKEIRNAERQNTIDSLLLYTEGRFQVIREVLEAVQKLKATL